MTQVIRILKTPVTLIVLLFILVYGGVWGLNAASAPIAKTSNPCVLTDVGTKLTPKSVQVRLLNGGDEGGLAKRTATYMRAYGFTVLKVNNTDREITKTVIVGNSKDDPEVKLVQQFFPDSTAEGDGRADHVVDVLLGDDSTQAGKPNTSVAVSGKVCLPQSTTSTASASASSTSK